jgi:hypothetical protein
MSLVQISFFFVKNLLNAFPVLLTDWLFLYLLLRVHVLPKITGITMQFIFHVRWISMLRFLYVNFFSASFCITFLSDGIVASLSKKILSVLCLIIMSGLLARTYLLILLHFTAL